MVCYIIVYHIICCYIIGRSASLTAPNGPAQEFGRGDDTVGNPHRAQISQFELFELVLLLELDKTVPRRAIRGSSISVSSTLPPLSIACAIYYATIIRYYYIIIIIIIIVELLCFVLLLFHIHPS